MRINFRINGKEMSADVPPYKRALDFLRDDLRLMSVKEGCGEGECGACTIIVDGKNIPSCLMLAVELDGKDVWTLEGLVEKGDTIIQDAFIRKGAIQCGFCTPGFIMSVKALLNENPDPTDEEIKEALEGNLCRCTGYLKIVEAVKEAVKMLKIQGGKP
ncbi:MAG: (2Fe-2S)-binding protein [Thermotogae bacterium]|nr:(2Fe-2S)-binding protein [Thermotogaceae bacterium]RKX38912.1 MAG: (2Fe-2S)-binding protein [Thermotogota bacterium]RKX50795.1 MAG: (2Fe-2S)-binding protein [Thermotogota bacterium]RKX54418.1 MAG: (2Fe-2S)-binding protein [Thermotoga sp.]